MNNKKPIDIIKNYDFKPSQIYEKDGGLFATIQENIISQIVEARDEEYYNFLIKQIRDFIVKNNIETCFVINKEELIDCLQEHNELHCKINNLQSQLDHQKARIEELEGQFAYECECNKQFVQLQKMWNELKEWLKEQINFDKEEIEENKEIPNLPNRHYLTIENIILDKMQELEKGEKDE